MGSYLCAVAQEDTTFLDQVVISGHYLTAYDAGVQVRQVDSVQLFLAQAQSLGDLLQQQTGLYLRQYGAEGQNTSISFRGTTPYHTTLQWNGVNLNSPSLGQADFSGIPVFLLEEIALYRGGASSLFGSGSIGGNIQIRTQPGFRRGLALAGMQQVGSFGKWHSGVAVGYGWQRWAISAKAYRQQVENDFPVRYRGSTYPQNNAASLQQGVLISTIHRVKERQQWLSEVWYHQHHRALQPIIGNRSSTDELTDHNLRINLRHQWNVRQSLLETSVSHIRDRQWYNNGEGTHIYRTQGGLDYEWSPFAGWQLRAGGIWQWLTTEVASYATDTSQWRSDQYLLFSGAISPRLDVAFTLRKNWVQGVKAPFTPALGWDFWLTKGRPVQWAWKSLASANFRAPTLNELFWEPGGNPLLRPERSQGLETGWHLAGNGQKENWTAALTAFRTWVSDMVIWVPSGQYWSPTNIQEVHIHGLELDAAWEWPRVPRLKVWGNWNYTRSINQTAFPNARAQGKQLAYVPLHKSTLGATGSFKSWDVQTIFSHTGKRFTESANERSLDGFAVISFTLSRTWSWPDQRLVSQLAIENLLNADYQNYELRAMPGRHFSLKINYQFQTNP